MPPGGEIPGGILIMNIHILAADIARRIPEMALDGAQNNSELIEKLIGNYLHLSVNHHEFRYEETSFLDDGSIVVKFKRFKRAQASSTPAIP